MKKNNWKSYLKMVGCMVIGAVIGMLMNFVAYRVGKNNLQSFSDGILHWLDSMYLVIAIVLLIVCVIVNGSGMFRLRRLIRAADLEEEDDAIESAEERIEGYQGALLTFSAVMIAISMMMMGMCEEQTFGALESIGAYFLCFVVALIFQTVIIHQIQKRDPRLKGDPNGLHFQKKFLESCDEAERMKIFRSTYYSYILLSQAFPILLGVALFLKFLWGTDSTAIVLIGILWLTQIISNRIYVKKEKKIER